jgi:hypothetical protein
LFDYVIFNICWFQVTVGEKSESRIAARVNQQWPKEIPCSARNFSKTIGHINQLLCSPVPYDPHFSHVSKGQINC